MELNAEQIKRALGSCYPIGATRCKECPYSKNGSVNILFTETHTCYDQMAIDALALINSQEQRIGELEKRLRYLLQSKTIAEYDEVDIHTKEYVKDIHSLDANIKGLTVENEKIGIENFDLICELSRIKEDTVRKMQERLK